ncbi:FecR domain-containing protein, partial [bacterium]|nr:FecR domain-containing protein [bacterium]
VVNLPLQPKDRLWVPQGAWAQVESRDGSVIRLDAGSSLEILGVEEKALQLYLGSGQGYVNFRNRGDTMLQVDTPVASFRSYDDVV